MWFAESSGQSCGKTIAPRYMPRAWIPPSFDRQLRSIGFPYGSFDSGNLRADAKLRRLLGDTLNVAGGKRLRITTERDVRSLRAPRDAFPYELEEWRDTRPWRADSSLSDFSQFPAREFPRRASFSRTRLPVSVRELPPDINRAGSRARYRTRFEILPRPPPRHPASSALEVGGERLRRVRAHVRGPFWPIATISA